MTAAASVPSITPTRSAARRLRANALKRVTVLDSDRTESGRRRIAHPREPPRQIGTSVDLSTTCTVTTPSAQPTAKAPSVAVEREPGVGELTPGVVDHDTPPARRRGSRAAPSTPVRRARAARPRAPRRGTGAPTAPDRTPRRPVRRRASTHRHRRAPRGRADRRGRCRRSPASVRAQPAGAPGASTRERTTAPPAHGRVGPASAARRSGRPARSAPAPRHAHPSVRSFGTRA